MSNLYVITYDIAHRRRLYRVAKTLEGWGERVQESVFECWLTQAELAEVKKALRRLIHPLEDRLRYYPLCSKDQDLIRHLGRGESTQDWSYLQIEYKQQDSVIIEGIE